MTSILTSVLASLLTMLSYTVELPFEITNLSNETTLDHYGQELALYFTMSEMQLEEYPDEYALINDLEQRFAAAGVTFVLPMMTYFPMDDRDQGHIDLLFSYNDGIQERRIFLNAGSRSYQITQEWVGPESVTLSVSSAAPLFKSDADTRTFTMSGGVIGKTYILSCNGSALSTITCDSPGSVSFGSF